MESQHSLSFRGFRWQGHLNRELQRGNARRMATPRENLDHGSPVLQGTAPVSFWRTPPDAPGIQKKEVKTSFVFTSRGGWGVARQNSRQISRPALPGRSAASLAYCFQQFDRRLTTRELVFQRFVAPQSAPVNGKNLPTLYRGRKGQSAQLGKEQNTLTLLPLHFLACPGFPAPCSQAWLDCTAFAGTARELPPPPNSRDPGNTRW